MTANIKKLYGGDNMATAITTVVSWAETMLNTIISNETLVVFFAMGVAGSVLGLVRKLVHTR